jgi:DNA-binding transcriptional LysR family regulator
MKIACRGWSALQRHSRTCVTFVGLPRGLLRISSGVGFGRKVVGRLLGEFRHMFPDIAFDLILDDRHADFENDRVDVALRSGQTDDGQVAINLAKTHVPFWCFADTNTPKWGRYFSLLAAFRRSSRAHSMNRAET